MTQKLNGGGRERASQVPDVHFKICNLWPKSAFCLPKTALETVKNGQMKRNSGYSTHAARLPRAEGPSRALYLHNMSANRPQKAPKSPRICAHWPPTAPNQKQTISWATWLKTQFREHLIHPQPPTFGGFHPSKLPEPTPRPPYLGLVGCSKLQEVAQRGGCQHGSPRSTGCKKMTFSKITVDHLECQNKCFWCVWSSRWPVLALLKSQNALKMGCIGTKSGSKMGQKCLFPKMIQDHLGCLNK